jgi:hypothetical protein
MRNQIFTTFLVFVSACLCSRVVAADDPSATSTVNASEYFRELPEKIAEDVHRAMDELEMFIDDSVLAADVTIQPFVEREAVDAADTAAVEVGASFLAVKWPTAENDFASMSFVLYVPNGEQGTMHTMHICGFMFPDECSNEIPFPGKEFGRCGASDVDRDRTGYFCDFVALHETVEDNGGGITRTLRGTCGKRRRCARRRRGNPFRTDPSRRRGTRRRPFPGARAFSRSRARTEIEPTHAASSRPSICGTSDDYTSGTGSTQLRHASRLAKRSSVKSLRCLPMSLFCSRF